MASHQHKTPSTPLSTISPGPDDLPPRNSPRRRTYCKTKFFGIPLYVLWTLLLIAILALVLPLAIMFGRKNRKSPPSTVLVPLYIYPDPGAWDPLFTAISTNPKTNFTIIINPNSGPGGPGLDANYTRDIPRLNSFQNVKTVGYVSTNYTNRDIGLVYEDIDTYVSWGKNVSTSGLGMRGIFLDETPSDWSVAGGKFYDDVTGKIRGEGGFGGVPLIIHNPGTIPDPQYLSSNSANITVVFEGSYASYLQYSSSKSIAALKTKREQLAAIVYGFPDGGDTRGFLKDVRRRVANVFLTGTGVDGDVYAGWWEDWNSWVREMV